LTPDIRHLAILARLEISDEEIADFSSQIARILEYAAVVSQVETDGIEPMSQAATSDGEPPQWREDVALPSMPRNEWLESAPDAHPDAGLFRVPKVL